VKLFDGFLNRWREQQDSEYGMANMKVLVLGGAGFIGSHIVDRLVALGHTVRVFDLPNISTGNLERSIQSVELKGGDFNNINDISSALKGMEVVIHLVCTTLPGPSNENPVYDVESNIIGTLNLLEKARQKGVRKIVFASSGGTVYGIPEYLPIPETHQTNPICSYGITKLAIEKYMALYRHLHGMDHTILRLGNPYGERQRTEGIQGVVAVFLGKVLRGEPIKIWGDGTVARDYFYVQDLVSAFIKVIELETPSTVYNIASGSAHSLMDILTLIHKITGKRPHVEFLHGRKLDVPISCLDIGLASTELGWQPVVPLAEGMARTWEWLKANVR
jgi:UDP-glucose 4-epimerase